MATYNESEEKANKEKNWAALSSVIAAVFITSFKLIIGLLTHSLGIMAEAAHSGLDLVAAAVTFFAVRISGRAPDEKQMFGYGKVENLSALFETLLLLLTCAWIIYEAIQRLFFKSVEVDISIWSFIVMITSITIDVSRSRVLMRAAKRHGSQALEADALHFSTDVWSSAVVIVGLILVTVGKYLQSKALLPEEALAWFHRADAIAAFGVSLIVIYVSVQLGKRTIDGLLDRAPQGFYPQIMERVSNIHGIRKVRQVRIRPSGPSTFVDMIIEIPRSATFEEAHSIAVEAKAIVKSLIDRVDVMVHLDPMVTNSDSIVESVQSVANRNGLSVHSIRLNESNNKISVDMHMEVPEMYNVSQAHETVEKAETQMRKEIPNLGEISIHIEPKGDQESRHLVDYAESENINTILKELSKFFPLVSECHNIVTYRENDQLSLSFHCYFSPDIKITEAHKLTTAMEQYLRRQIPELDRVYIHVEPLEK